MRMVYQPELHLPLEEMSYILLGRTPINMRGVARVALEQEVPLAFYSEKERGFGRFFIGRDYQRMDPAGRQDFRIELLERQLDGETSDGYESLQMRVGSITVFTGRVETAPLFRVWEFSLVPPAREAMIRDHTDAQHGLQYLTIAYVIHQDQEELIPMPVRHGLEER